MQPKFSNIQPPRVPCAMSEVARSSAAANSMIKPFQSCPSIMPYSPQLEGTIARASGATSSKAVCTTSGGFADEKRTFAKSRFHANALHPISVTLLPIVTLANLFFANA
jgi:hypothetical protein